MSSYSLNSDMNIEVTARFISKGTDAALSGPDYKLCLYDKDIVDTDYLGESGLDEKGLAKIKFSHSSFGEWNELEKYPDFYFILFKNDKEIFRSELFANVDVDFLEQFKMGEGETIDMGTFLVQV